MKKKELIDFLIERLENKKKELASVEFDKIAKMQKYAELDELMDIIKIITKSLE